MKSIYTAVLVAIMGIGLLMIGCGAPPTLEGDWVSNCGDSNDTDPGNPYPNSFMYETTYTDTTRTVVWTVFDDEDPEADPPTLGNCTEGEDNYKIESVHTYTTDTEQDPHWIDFTVVSTDMTVLNADALVIFNLIGVCGITDWVLDVPRDIMGRDCSIPPNPPQITPEEGEVVLGIYQFNEDGSELSTSGTTQPDDPRPTELSPWITHYRQ
jgi:hypothetical protein